MTACASHDAVLYVLECLTESEAAAFEEHAKGCSACRSEVERFRDVTSALALLAPLADPPADLRQRLLEGVAASESVRSAGKEATPEGVHKADRGAAASASQSWKDWAPKPSPEGLFVMKADVGELEPTGVAGVSAKALFVDPASDRITMLVRMEPGATYPAHRHAGAEESYILEGDITDGVVSLHAGDYLRKDGGTIHEAQSSDTGCFMLIVASLHEELMLDSSRA
ncbi:MAG TPA: cupin domain-containing protein [Thermoanaerobaculaceae bacterium]|nr:cupin domain-containing protein [Thermoanaerobaculaceae bacterium]